ncbi:MAG: gliding motility-associated C-terminal domain-containing protein [Psychroflexus sp.]|nr:gliding motility-associated C-terminal domain-containing protein [Psychroflexus sp.]
MGKSTFFWLLFFLVFTSFVKAQTTVDCPVGPVNNTFCYDSNVVEEFIYVSSNGSSLNLTVNSGDVEEGFDEFIVLDTNGTELYNGYGNAGDLAGLTFQSTGDEITVQVTPDFSISCQSSSSINPIDLTVSCATCTNPQVDFTLVDDCLNAPQFFVEVNVTDLGSANDLNITDNQGNPAQTASATGIFTFGPYPNGTLVELTASNNQDINCQVQSGVITQDNCTLNLVDCAVGSVNTNFCYDSSVTEEFTYVSSNGSPLNLTVNSGNVENNFDEFIVLDSNGTELYNGYGNAGDLAGLTFQSTGDEITVQVTPDGSIDCQSSSSINPIDLTVSCATCTNPQVDFTLVDDCLNAPQFFVEVNVIDLGSATDLDITDNQGNPSQTASATGVFTFGPYPNGTLVELTASNNQDINCQVQSGVITQDNCTLNLVDCAVGSVNTNFCYDSGVTEEFTYVSSNGSPLNLTVNSGNVENNFDEFIVLDSNGTELYNGYGNAGDLAGLTFQSTGDEITVQVTPDGSIDCQSSSNINPIDLTVSCATCVNPQVNYNLIGNCGNGNEEFTVEVEIVDLGTAPSLDITNNQGDPLQNVTSPTTLTYGPYPLGTDVVFTVENVDDVDCTLTSPSQTLATCGCFGPDPFCAPGPGEALIFENVDDSTGTEADPNLSNYGCLATQPNPVWFFMQVEDSGELVFEIVQNTQFDNQGNPIGTPLDVDFIAWGPFTDTQFCNDLDSCTQCGSNTFDNNYPYGNVMDCSYSAAPTETFTIPNAQAGEIYAVLITNFNGDPGFISLGQTNSDDPNSGSTNCDIVLQNQVTACQADGAVLTATDSAADQYQWLLFNESTQQFDPITGEDQPTLAVTESGLYQVLTLNGADVSTEEFDVTIIPEPENSLPTETAVCNNQTIILDATAQNPDDYDSFEYQWFLNNNPISGETQATLDVDQPGNYTVEISTTNLNIDADGNDLTCVNIFDIQVNSADFTVDLGEDQTFCDAGSQAITANVNGADDTNATYLWNTGDTTASIDVSDSGIYEVSVTIEGCTVTESVEYKFNESPVIALGPDTTTCDLTLFELDATPSNLDTGASVTYEWTLDGQPLNVNDDVAVINPDDFGFGNYEVNVYFDNPNCNTVDNISFSQRQISVDISSDDSDNLFCVDDKVTFSASLQDAEPAEANFEWFVNGENQNNNSATLENYSITSNQTSQSVSVEVSIGNECLASEQLTFNLYAIDNCVISQGLSPNGDGQNDNLDLRFLDDRTGITSFEVFNRYGQKVYEKANYRDEFFGQSDNGNNLETGTYFYVIKFDKEDESFGIIQKGWIYINQEQ